MSPAFHDVMTGTRDYDVSTIKRRALLGWSRQNTIAVTDVYTSQPDGMYDCNTSQ